jgi:uncharacterized protein YjiS (DUF1127 family)
MTGIERDLLSRALAGSQSLLEGAVRRLGRLLRLLLRWQELERQRRQLLSMDDRTLKDIGLTHWQARRLASGIARDEITRMFLSGHR